ncbi:MAG TPA: ABC transporter ATP-binding protein [Candidatus Fimivicinus intestinavium]|nr:ABC transporter ATP-binding protein [Candidatus Fimivicinus intestinavium]
MANLIDVEHLSKSYGSNRVLEDISFSFEAGNIIGLLGPNGSGKTSLIKIMTGLINDYEGSVKIDGHRPGPYTKSIVAYLPEKTYLADWMRPVDAVGYFADFYADFDKAKAVELINGFHLPMKQKIKSMSKGMQEKLQLVLVMCRRARLYLLDEPLGGVDPAARAFILDFIMKNYAENASILLSTHLINDLERIFDRALMIGNGKVLVNTAVEEIHATGKTLEETFKEVFAYAWQID